MIAGLGNPGPEYRESRHNLGFMVADEFTSRARWSLPQTRFRSLWTERRVAGHRVVVLKPLTYMNRSGQAVAAAMRSLGLLQVPEAAAAGSPTADFTQQLLVIYDDMDLPLGRVRFRDRGSSGGHRGVESLLEELGTERFGRLRVGVGRDDPAATEGGESATATATRRVKRRETVDYLLNPLSSAEKEAFQSMVPRIAGTLNVWIRQGTAACANRFNGVADWLAQNGETRT